MQRKRVYFKDTRTGKWTFLGEHNHLSSARREAQFMKNRGLKVKIQSATRTYKL